MEAAGITDRRMRCRKRSILCFLREREETVQREQKTVRVGMAVIACALLIRILSGLAGPVAAFLGKPENAAFLIYLETGRKVKPSITPAQTQPTQTTDPTQSGQTTAPTQPEQTEPEVAPTEPEQSRIHFRPEDAALVQVSNLCAYSVDKEALLLSALDIKAASDAPSVLILHSHTTESYTQAQGDTYTPTAAYRTLDAGSNMLRVGEVLKTELENRGLRVIHDRTIHDYPSYTDAYINSRETVEKYLQAYPSICMVIDLHRDAAETDGGQLATDAAVNGKKSAQLMLVVGTDASGRTHDHWEKNLALAVKLHAHLEQLYPGICRPISFRKERFNQDLSPGAMLIEVGAAGDTLQEALTAAGALAEALADLVTVDSTR